MVRRALDIKMTSSGNAGKQIRATAKTFSAGANQMKTEAGKLSAATKRAGAESKKFFDIQKIGQGVLMGVGAALTGLAQNALRGAVQFFKDATAAAAEQELQEKRLLAALNLRGKATTNDVATLKNFAGALQQATGQADELTLKVMAQMSALGVHKSQLGDGVKAAMAWANITGKDMKSAALDVTKALNGNVMMLQKYGLAVNNSDEAMAALLEKYKIVEAETDTLAIQTKRLDSNQQDLAESAGILAAKVLSLKDRTSDYADATLGATSIVEDLTAAVEAQQKALGAGLADLTDGAAGADELKTAAKSLGGVLLDSLIPGLSGSLEQTELLAARGKVRAIQMRKEAEATKVLTAAERDRAGIRDVSPEQQKDIDAIVKASVTKRKLEAQAAERRAADRKRDRERQEATDERAADRAFNRLVKQHKEQQEALFEADRSLAQAQFDWEEGQKEDRQRLAGEQTEAARQAAADLAQEQTTLAEGASRFLVGSFTSAFSGVIAGTKSVGAAFGQMVESIVAKVAANLAILTLATIFSGGAAGFGAFTSIGGALGKILGFGKGGEVPRFAGGGEVTGGTSGTDSVMALLTPGETVLTVELTNMLKSVMGRLNNSGGFAAGGTVGGGGGVVFAPVFNGVATSTADLDEWLETSMAPRFFKLLADRQIGGAV